MKLGNDYLKQIARRVDELEDQFALLNAIAQANSKALKEVLERLDEEEEDYEIDCYDEYDSYMCSDAELFREWNND